MNGEMYAGGDILASRELLQQDLPVVILDAGAQYVDLIQKACERLGFKTDILPLNTPFETIKDRYGAFLISGGPASSHTEDAPMPDPTL